MRPEAGLKHAENAFGDTHSWLRVQYCTLLPKNVKRRLSFGGQYHRWGHDMRLDLVDPEPADLLAAVAKLLEGQNKSEVARELDISRETLYRWERGESVPDITELQRLAHTTGNEVRISFNVKEDEIGLEQQVHDLRDAFAVFAAGRVALLELVEEIHPDDPDIHQKVERIRTAMRRIPKA